MKLSELISAMIKRDDYKITIVDIFECEIGHIDVKTDFDWSIKSKIPIDVFKSNVVEICFFPSLKELIVMIDVVYDYDRT